MLRFSLLLLGLAAVLPAAPIYDFTFVGTYAPSSFVAPPAILQNLQTGDPFRLTFSVDAATAVVSNIVAAFPTQNIFITPPGTTTWTSWPFTSLYHYRWDIQFPDYPAFTMNFWFRTSIPGVVQAGVPTPESIDVSKFLTHGWAIFQGTPQTGGPQAMLIQVTNTPEPASAAVILGGLAVMGLVAAGGQRRLRN